MDLKIKDFAAAQGVSESIIYRHIRQHKEALGDRVIKRGNATWLTEEGQEYIRGLMIQQPIVVGDADTHRRVEDLQAEILRLHEKLESAQDALRASLQAQIDLQGAQALLEASEKRTEALEANLEAAEKESKILEGFIQDAKAEIATLTEEKAQAAARATDAEAALEAVKNMSPLRRMFWKGK